jgi:hypothetical protein
MYSKNKKPRERQVADKLVKQHELNEKLRDKKITNNFWKLFGK